MIFGKVINFIQQETLQESTVHQRTFPLAIAWAKVHFINFSFAIGCSSQLKIFH